MAITQEQKLPSAPKEDGLRFGTVKRMVSKVFSASLPELVLVLSVVVAAAKEIIGGHVSAAFVAMVGFLILHITATKFFNIKKEKENAGSNRGDK